MFHDSFDYVFSFVEVSSDTFVHMSSVLTQLGSEVMPIEDICDSTQIKMCPFSSL